MKMRPKYRVYKMVLHTIKDGIEKYEEFDGFNRVIVTTTRPSTLEISLLEILYYDRETNLLVKSKTGNIVTHYKYNENQKLIGYYTEEV